MTPYPVVPRGTFDSGIRPPKIRGRFCLNPAQKIFAKIFTERGQYVKIASFCRFRAGIWPLKKCRKKE